MSERKDLSLGFALTFLTVQNWILFMANVANPALLALENYTTHQVLFLPLNEPSFLFKSKTTPILSAI